MAFPKETSQPVISTKRPLDDADVCELDEFRKPKTMVRKYPRPKIRIGVEAVRDFPPGCGILQDSLVSKVEKKPLNKLENVESNIGNLTSHGKDKMVSSQSFEDNKINSFKPAGLGFKKPSFGSKPSGKVKFWDPTKQVVHDFPPVCGIKPERKPLKNLDNFDSDLKKLNSIDKNKVEDCDPVENNKLKSFKPKESGINNNPFGSRSTGKVKHRDPTSNDGDIEISKDTTTVESRKEQVKREKIQKAMILFETVYTQLFQENRSKQKGEKIAHWRVPMEAAKTVKQKLKWMDADKTLGQIRGVQPGDRFKFRSQLQMVGLHCQSHCGIDYTKINGKNLAISIVDSHRYSNASESCDVLSYCGEGGGGGVGFFGSKRQVAPDDQKLERGNLALKNSMDEKGPVRVIRKFVGGGKKNTDVFVYDGLYTVEHCTQKRGSEGKMVFMFELHKIPGQPQFQKKVNAIHNHSTFQML